MRIMYIKPWDLQQPTTGCGRIFSPAWGIPDVLACSGPHRKYVNTFFLTREAEGCLLELNSAGN